jgi:hypothetical protein
MMHIIHKISASKIQGIGLFADQDIIAGSLIYTPSPLLDVDITQTQFETLTTEEQKSIKYYGYWNKKTQKWHVAFDAIRILNHGDAGTANVSQGEDMVMRAIRNISTGEELLQDYLEIYPDNNEHFNRIKK